jgi:hypothetical protein
MANQNHLNKFLEGINAWNEWRDQNPTVMPDLSHSRLNEWNIGCVKSWDMKSKGVNLEKANLWNTDLSRAALIFANLKGAVLIQAKLHGSCLIGADLRDADLLNADLRGSNLTNVNLEGANVSGVKYDRFAKYRGIRTATCFGSPRFRRFAQDQDFIEELREESRFGRFLYCLWLIFADCGRSFWPLLLWSFVFFSLFGVIYADYTIPSWLSWLPQPLKEFIIAIDPKIDMPHSHSNFTPYYFSVVTFTTLGFRDVKPLNLAGEIFVVMEVLLGYVMLGLLISILSNKIARRS